MLINKILKKLGIHTTKSLNSYMAEQHYYPMGQFQENDISIVGYPKSGNTWMQHILASLIFGIQPQLMPDKLVQELIPQIYTKGYNKRFLDFTCFTSHELPRPDFKKAIYLVRDGRDVMASYFAFNVNLGVDVSLEDMIKNGTTLFPSKWHQHTKAWIENPYNAAIIYIRYEDLLLQPEVEIKKILSFLNIHRSIDLIQQVIKGNQFETMKSKEKKYGWDSNEFPKDKPFVRKGKIGNYKKELPKTLIDYFEKESYQSLKYFNYL